MIVPILALISAFFIGVNSICISKGLDHGTRLQALFITLLVNNLVFWALLFFFVGIQAGIQAYNISIIVWFLFLGLLGPSLGRMLNFSSFQRIGVARTMPIVGAAPLFATFIAIGFLGERFSFYILIGIFLIMLGIALLSREKNQKGDRAGKKDLLLPLLTACVFGLTIALSKKGLLILENPLIAVTFTVTSALAAVLLYTVFSGKLKELKPVKPAFLFYTFAGIATSIAFLSNFTALSKGNVSLVAPMLATFPLFGVFLSHFFLQEGITKKIWLGAVIIVLGIIAVNFSS
ncbi:DMT family transporter [Patescibacteria group bacterium]|nr:DMT family transporter [Patescibacteria group bacterium]